MLKKRLAVIVALALVATLPPMVFQYVVEPRMDGANVDIEILGILYDGDESSEESTAFSVALKLTNEAENDAILSPLDLDVYYRSSDTSRYRLIGKLTTNKDFTIPGEKSVDNGDADENFISSVVDGANLIRDDTNEKKGYNVGEEIKGTLYFYKQAKGQTFYEGANEALVDLINDGSIDLKFSGDALFGPVSIPIETPDIDLDVTVWDPELILRDVFIYEDEGKKTDTFVLHTKMRNPSGLPMIIEEFEVSLLNETGDVVGLPISSIEVAGSSDPDDTDKTLSEVYLDNQVVYKFVGAERFAWQDVFLAFNFSTEENIGWFISKLMDEPVLSGFTMYGEASIILGQREKGFKIDMSNEEDYLRLQNVQFYQKYIDKYPGIAPFTGQDPLTMLGNFSVGELRANRMIVDTQNNEMTLDISADMALTNSYRFEYAVDDFLMSYKHKNSGGLFAKSETPTSYNVAPAYRDVGGDDPTKILTRTTDIPVNLTTTYDTGDQNAGVYQLFEDLDNPFDDVYLPDLLNLTNPFYLEKGTDAYENNPLTTIEFLLQQDINPLTLLNEVDLKYHMEEYRPLEGSFFGSYDRDLVNDDVRQQASSNTAMPYARGTSFPLASHLQFCRVDQAGADWDAYYPGDLRGENQYAVVDHTFADGYFTDDEDLSTSYDQIIGAIFTDDPSRTGSYDGTSASDLVWRVYGQGSATAPWGYDYDYFGNGERGYYVGVNLPTGNDIMFSNDFTLNPSVYNNDESNIEKVTLSVSYKYIDEAASDNAHLMFGWYDGVNDYDYSGFSGTEPTWCGRDGWALPNPGNGEWDVFSVDLTSEFLTHLPPSPTTNDLKAEISLSGREVNVNFDDAVLNIEYKDDISDLTGSLNLEDLFNYLEEMDPSVGNMYSILNETLTEEQRVEFWRYLGQDGAEINDPTTEGMDLFQYMQYHNVSLSTLTDILQNRYTELNIGEPANFLEMLTNSKYRATNNPFDAIIDTKYGPRVDIEQELPDYFWTIEDPYNASRGLMKALEKNIYFDEDTGILSNDFYGEELWHMLENLGVTMPWVIMYLLTHGWTKNDIFDVLQALGLGMETHTGYGSSYDYGYLTVVVEVEARAVFGAVKVGPTDITIEMNMDPVLSDGTQAMFSALCYNTNPTLIVDNEGYAGGQYYFNEDGELDLGLFSIDINVEMWIRPQEFYIEIGVLPEAGFLIPPPTTLEDDSFLHSGAGGGQGLGLAGTRELASNMRIQYKFTGDPFISNGGDPVSLFQFLDSFYFGERDNVDYSSFQLLNHFDVSSQDFIDIITGYNRIYKMHDYSGPGDLRTGNGQADDWLANPADYDPNLEGYGTSFRDNRIYYGPDDDEYGHNDYSIIWSDSPDFALSGHADGLINSDDDIREGAPPIVDLFDMLAWISRASGKPDPNELFLWLLGELPPEYYEYIDPADGQRLSASQYREGMSNQKTWRMLRDASFNATGFFDWMERSKNINSFTFLSVLDKSTDKVGPLELLYFATRPNLIKYSDGALSFLFHDGLDSQNTVDANDALWNFYNEENSFMTLDDVKALFEYLEEVGFNTFDTFNALAVDPASWLSVINNDYGLSPIDVIKRIKRGDYSGDYINPNSDFASGASSLFSISANMTFTYGGGILIPVDSNLDIKEIRLTGAEHFSNFISPSTLSGSNFIIY